ncbi:hypothetical protein ACTUTK_23035, partial [Pantoea ananatis]|uniref:hypothetical protein n=1 Tax=Pantoea ananas TaxID=553 RepID=UPI003FA49ACE
SENTSERTGNGVLRSILLFNNPEQAENLKRRIVVFLRNKEHSTTRSSLSKAYSLQANCEAVTAKQINACGL